MKYYRNHVAINMTLTLTLNKDFPIPFLTFQPHEDPLKIAVARKRDSNQEPTKTKMSRTTILGYNNLTVFAHHPKPDQSEIWLVS